MKFPVFYGTRKFITAFTRGRHLSLSIATSIFPCPQTTSWRFILIISSHLRLGNPSSLFLSSQKSCTNLIIPIHATCPAYPITLVLITRTIFFFEPYRSLSSSLCSFLHSPVTSTLFGQNVLLCTYSKKPSAYVPPSMWATKFHTHIKQHVKLKFCIYQFFGFG